MTDVTLRQLILFCASGVLDTPTLDTPTLDAATDEHQIARYREVDGTDDDPPHSYCTECPAWHTDADEANAHRESHDHRATWDERQSFAARRTHTNGDAA